MLFEPLDLVAKLATMVPPPRFNLVRYHGVLAPGERWRRNVVPAEVDGTGLGQSCDCWGKRGSNGSKDGNRYRWRKQLGRTSEGSDPNAAAE